MPINVSIWRIGEQLQPIDYSSMDSEERLETLLAGDLSVLGDSLLPIGRQVSTAFGKRIDLLAMDGDGNLVIFELKRDRTPREVVAQLLDYGSWIRTLTDDDVAGIFDDFLRHYHPAHAGTSLDDAFCERYHVDETPESWNEGHELFIVASELDDSTERIVTYLSEEHGVAINVIFFRCFKDGDREYLSRAWLIDPTAAEVQVAKKGRKQPWNGEFYVSFGEGSHRRWSDAEKYGFVSAGGSPWYSRTLSVLEPGDRIWGNVPGQGYVGVGRVTENVVPVTEFMVQNGNGQKVPITQVSLKAPAMHDPNRSADEQEHVVRVEWLKTVPLENAIKEKGFFGNQNSVAKPRSKKWSHTIERLRTRFGITD